MLLLFFHEDGAVCLIGKILALRTYMGYNCLKIKQRFAFKEL